jgi:4,5-dihydroxyphthalate decarboxylase
VRKSLLDDNPWLANSLFQAYSKAKFMAYQSMIRIGWGADMLPWYGQELEDTQQTMGQDWYSYGLEGNELALNTLFRYSHEQGLSSRQLTIQELFHPSATTGK